MWFNPARRMASGVSSATWWQAAQSTLTKVARPEILDTRGVEGEHSRASVPGMF